MGKFLGLLSSWESYFTKIFGGDQTKIEAANSVMNVVQMVLWIVLAIVGAAGIIYSIYLGVRLATAEDQGKRDEAKKHLITVIIAIVVTLVLVVFFNTILPLILEAFL